MREDLLLKATSRDFGSQSPLLWPLFLPVLEPELSHPKSTSAAKEPAPAKKFVLNNSSILAKHTSI